MCGGGCLLSFSYEMRDLDILTFQEINLVSARTHVQNTCCAYALARRRVAKRKRVEVNGLTGYL